VSKTDTTKYKLLCNGGIMAAEIQDGEFKGIPLGLCMALEADILQKKITADKIRQRGWEYASG
jgi:hypothetical protein